MIRNVSRFSRARGPLIFAAARANGSMAGKAVIVSGASGGIGEEVGLLFAKKGAKVFLAARSVDKLEAVADACRSAGATATATMRCDVSNDEDCKALVRKAIDEFGAIDVLVLNAGLGQVLHTLHISKHIWLTCAAAIICTGILP